MSTTLTILCVDDQAEVVAAVRNDLAELAPLVEVVTSDDPTALGPLIDDLLDDGQFLALVISDQVMPGKSGVEVLKEIRADKRLTATRVCLLTGQASHEDTIRAINEARIDSYIAKPWDHAELIAVCKRLLTEAVFDAGIDHQPLLSVLDPQRVFELLHQGG